MSTDTLEIHYYSDVLCIWAWIAQRRIDELQQHFGERIAIKQHAIDVFGSSHEKIQRQWKDKGLFAGFADHVSHGASNYPDAIVHPDIWHKCRPSSSANAHLFIKAAALSAGEAAAKAYELQVRKAFFCDAQDISDFSVLNQQLEQQGLNPAAAEVFINNGQAMAALMLDYQHAKQLNLQGSPSYIIDNGRQVLFGNVGYRILQANIEEHLKRPSGEASWC